MDLRLLTDQPSADERMAVDAVLGAPPAVEPTVSLHEAKRRRPMLLPVLNALQRRAGHISKGGLAYACERLGVPPAEAFGVASFYAMFALAERPAAFAHVCDDIACAAAGAQSVCAALESSLGPSAAHAHRAETAGHDTPKRAQWSKSPCLGLCEQAPAALVTVAGAQPLEQAFGAATAEKISSALRGERVNQVPIHIGGEGPRKLLARAGKIDPTSLEAYRAAGGYSALERARALGPGAVIAEVSGARLVGRGGAAFPTGRKWDAVAKAAGDIKYVVCNADESEPGTFKDRVLLEMDPFAVVEAVTVAGFATGAQRGFIYIRGEYPLCIDRIEHAVREAQNAGLLGPAAFGEGRAFDIEVRRGAGAYICGEETALFASIEGFRGEPRSKPPFPVHHGLFGKPTAINNVETLVATLDIVRDGAPRYAEVGTPGSPGTKLFCVSGKVKRPGIYEVPFGTRLDALIALAGGAARPIAGVLLGGAAGTFLNPSQLSVQLSFEHTREAGTTLGSGVVFVLDDSVPLLPLLRRIAEFFRDESCGQCVPCRVGTVRQEELLSRLARNAPLASAVTEQALYAELSQAMKDASICGLGQTAVSAIESAFKNFPALRGTP